MIKIYGLHTCPYCDYIVEQIKGQEDKFEYIDIGQHVRNLHEFIELRDAKENAYVFDKSRAVHDIGIPCFVLEDGSITLDPAKVGLIEYGSSVSCSIDDHKAGKQGC